MGADTVCTVVRSLENIGIMGTEMGHIWVIFYLKPKKKVSKCNHKF